MASTVMKEIASTWRTGMTTATAFVAAVLMAGCHPALDDVAMPCGRPGQTCPTGQHCKDKRCVSGSAQPDLGIPDRGKPDEGLTVADASSPDLDMGRPDIPVADLPPAKDLTLDLASPPEGSVVDAPLKPDQATKPDQASKPDAAQPDAAQPDAAQPDASIPDAVQPDTLQPDLVQPDAAVPPKPLAGVCEPSGWCWSHPTPQGNSLHSIWGTSANNLYTVGEKGTVLQYNGTSWKLMDSGTYADLYSLWGSGASAMVAVGKDGKHLVYDGSKWKTLSPATSLDYYGLWGSSATDIWVVGQDGTVALDGEVHTVAPLHQDEGERVPQAPARRAGLALHHKEAGLVHNARPDQHPSPNPRTCQRFCNGAETVREARVVLERLELALENGLSFETSHPGALPMTPDQGAWAPSPPSSAHVE